MRASRCCVYRAVISQDVVLPSSSLPWRVREQQQSFHSWLGEFNRIRTSGAAGERGRSLLWEERSVLPMELLPGNSSLFGDNLAEMLNAAPIAVL